MSDDKFYRRSRWIWMVIIIGFIAVAALELLGSGPSSRTRRAAVSPRPPLPEAVL
nr:hypothetical protein GCM10020093_099690 [Planobispora longispora]